MSEEIPISTAKDISKKYDYDQVIIIARKVGEDGTEHVTTYGKDKENCQVAADVGNFLKYKIMGWKPSPQSKAQEKKWTCQTCGIGNIDNCEHHVCPTGETRIQKLEKALRVYADKGNWEDSDEWYYKDLWNRDDSGYEIAAEALEGDSSDG